MHHALLQLHSTDSIPNFVQLLWVKLAIEVLSPELTEKASSSTTSTILSWLGSFENPL